MTRWGQVARRAAVMTAALWALAAGLDPVAARAQDASLTEFREVTQRGDYESEGTGMVGTGGGAIEIVTPPGSTVTEAHLYWVIVAPGRNPSFDEGTFNGRPVDGTLVAVGDDPCRDPDPNGGEQWHAYVYRADVTGAVNPSGTGLYPLAGFATGTSNPTDPDGVQPPINEGAMLVVLYENPAAPRRVITMYEGAATVDEAFFETVTTTLRFAPVAGGDGKTTYGVADGQPLRSEVATFDELVFPEQFNGDDGPFMDVDTFPVGAVLQPGETEAVVTVGEGDDCITHFAQVFSAATLAQGDPQPEPATLTLDPPTAVVEIGEPHTVTATVRTVTGEPVPNTLVRFDVSGSVETTGTCTTNADGRCSFTFDGPNLPGAVTITAYADVDRDATQDPGEPTGVATAEFVVPRSTPLCEIKITYGGWIRTSTGSKATFGGNGKADENRGTTGQTEYQDHALVPYRFHGEVVAVLCLADNRGVLFARGKVDGIGADTIARIDVTDVGEPGSGRDSYWFQAPGYDSGGPRVLGGGNVQVHRQT